MQTANTAKAEVVDNNREQWPCSHCTAVLCRKSSLRRHEILTHRWDPRTNTTALDEVVEQMRPKKVSKDIVATAITAAGIGLELSDDELEDASVTSQHPVLDEIIIPDVEPGTSRTTLTQPSATVTEAPDPTVRIPTKPMKILANPRPVSETDHPCQRRQNDKVQAPGAVAKSKTVQELKRQGAETCE